MDRERGGREEEGEIQARGGGSLVLLLRSFINGCI